MTEFGAFRYDAESRVLSRDEAEIPLAPRVLAVLESLLKRLGKIGAKEAVLESAWEGAFVGEDSLTQAISQLRSALGDDPQRPRYIQTIPKRGYRFIAEVSEPLRNQGPIPEPVEAEDDEYAGAAAASASEPPAEGDRAADVHGPGSPPVPTPSTLAAGTKVRNYELLALVGAGAMGDIATIHGVEDAGGTPFIVMELLQGETLQERLRHGPLPIDEALEVAAQIARALEVAHNAGIIHRDLGVRDSCSQSRLARRSVS